MKDDLDAFAREMQEQLTDGYSCTVVDHAFNPRNLGRPDEFCGEGRFKGPCGDTMVVWIGVEGETITDVGFWTDGCGTSIASGSMVTELADGKTLEEAMHIGQKEVLEALEWLPPENEHCALLAATALRLAIKDCRRNRDLD